MGEGEKECGEWGREKKRKSDWQEQGEKGEERGIGKIGESEMRERKKREI